MRHHGDDLGPFENDPLLQALRRPGSPSELSGESEALAAFRQAGPTRLRVLRRIGTGGATISLAVIASTGIAAAAAYTSSLPTPLQRFAHSVFGPIGVPEPNPHPMIVATHHRRLIAKQVIAGTTAAVPATMEPSSAGSFKAVIGSLRKTPTKRSSIRATIRPVASSSAGSPAATSPVTTPATPPPTPTPTPTATPTSTPPATSPSPTPTTSSTSTAPPPQPASITEAISSNRVDVGSWIALSGEVLGSDGQPVPQHRVALWEIDPGAGKGNRSATRIAVLRTDSNGDVDDTVADVTHNCGFVLRLAGLHSAVLRVVALPRISASVVASSSSASTTATIDISTDGGDPGDPVTVVRRVGDQRQRVATVDLDSDGDAGFTVPESNEAVSYRIVLKRSRQHASAITRVTVPAD